MHDKNKQAISHNPCISLLNRMDEWIMKKWGFGKSGSSATADDVVASLNLHYLTVLITGATSGIGLETARVLASKGARIVIPVRNVKAARSLFHEYSSHSDSIIIMNMDLTSLTSVRAFTAKFLSLNIPLNVLINNAGVVSRNYSVSEDGYELHFATNHLGHFLLTNLLLEKMAESAQKSGIQGRIVNVSSALHRWVQLSKGIDFHSLNDQNSFRETLNYAQSKLFNILHANELARRLKEVGANVTANSLHPGIVRTNITRDYKIGILTGALFFMASLFTKSISQGAATTCYVAVHPKVQGASGKYFADCDEVRPSPLAHNTELARQLWVLSEEFCRLPTTTRYSASSLID